MSYTEHIVKFPNRFLMFKMYNVKGLIEDGKMTTALKNMRFNTSVVDMLKAVDMISKERLTKEGFIGPTVAPYLRTDNFTFSSKTSF